MQYGELFQSPRDMLEIDNLALNDSQKIEDNDMSLRLRREVRQIFGTYTNFNL